MASLYKDDFSKLEYEGWQRVAGQYLTNWATLTQLFIEPLLDAANVSKNMKVLDVACGPGIVSEKIKLLKCGSRQVVRLQVIDPEKMILLQPGRMILK